MDHVLGQYRVLRQDGFREYLPDEERSVAVKNDHYFIPLGWLFMVRADALEYNSPDLLFP